MAKGKSRLLYFFFKYNLLRRWTEKCKEITFWRRPKATLSIAPKLFHQGSYNYRYPFSWMVIQIQFTDNNG